MLSVVLLKNNMHRKVSFKDILQVVELKVIKCFYLQKFLYFKIFSKEQV